MNRAAIHDITLKARQLLMAEAYDLLEGIYGLHADGRFESAKNLPAIQAHADLRQTRKRLEKYL
ncbi:MAG: hypothetical protein L0287_31165, partial [Anaerolineae bacterium]|nr:hypothetical protein [Anaerolineae bacterium]